MKSFFTKLGKLLLCGVAVAVVGCTDYDTDIQNVNDRLDGLKQETTATAEDLAEAIAALEAKLATQYATKEYVDGLNKEVKDQLTKDVTALSGRIDAANKAIEDAVATVSTQLSALDDKKADKTALNEAVKAIEDLEKELNTVKTDLEGEIETVKTQIADAKAELNEKIAGVDAKANELQNTLASLSEYLEGLEAKVNEINNTLLSLSEYLPEMKAELEAKINAVDAKAEENYNTLVSLSEHLAEYEATTDLKLTELQGSLAALSTYLETYEAEVEAKFTEIRNTLDSLSEYLDEKFAELADTDTDLYNEINGLREVISSINNLLALETENREEADKALDAKILELRNTLVSLEPVIESLQNEDQELWKQYNELQANVGQIYTTLTERINATDAALAAHKAAYETKVAEIEAKINELNNTLLSLSEYLPEMKAALEAKINELRSTLVSLEPVIDNLQNEDVQLQQQITELQNNLAAALNVHADDVAAIYAALKENTEELAGQIQTTQNALSSALLYINMNSENIEKLMSQVQSLVYVPDYSDHKATIDWAMIATTNVMPSAAENDAPAYSIVAKATDLKYLVKANAGEDAVTVAAKIAANPSALDYIVTDVKTRGASQTGADLEIVNVKAEGEYIIVSVVAKKFDAKFFENKRQGIYSAALALVDANGNNLTSEYTNLVPGEAAHIQMGLYLTEADDVMNVAGTEETTKMPCNDSETVYTSLTPAIGFIIDDEKAMANLTSVQPYLTVEDLKALGYDMDVKYRLNLANAMDLDIPGYSMSNNTINKYFITGNDAAGNVTVSVKENTPFTEKGKSIFAKYTATANGTTVTYVHYFVLSNAQVTVDMETSAEWTIALQDALYDGKNHYARNYILVDVPFKAVGGPVAHLKPVLNSPAVIENGYPKFYVKDAEGEWVEVENRSFELAAFNDNATVDIRLLGGTYSWNNSYKIVWSTTNDVDNVDYTTTAIVNLVGRPDEINVTIPVDFKLLGTNTWFEAPADLLGESFKALDKYLEYGDSAADLAKWSDVFNSFVTRYNNVELAMPVVNGETSKWIANLDQLATAKLFIGKNKIYEDQPNVITWSVKPWWGVPVNFTITGDVTVPATAENFIYSQDYVKDINTRPYAEVFGKIDDVEVEGDEVRGASKKYSIIKSDLAKYFNLDIESLEGHNYTVDFEVTLPDAESEIGNVKVLPETTTPVVTDKGAATYYYFLQDQAVLDWDTYRGLEVIVNATLKVNGYTVDSKKLSLITKDPLTLTGADFSVTRQLRDNTVIPVYQKLVLTSSVETSYKNLLSKEKSKGTGVYDTLADAEAYANGVYGADIEVVLGPKGVYYYDNTGKLIILGTNKYGYNEQTGVLTIYGDDANVKNYYADFTAVMSSVICGGEHKVPFRVTATVAK